MIPAPFLRNLWSILMPDRATVTYQAQTSLGVYSSSSVGNTWWRPGGGTVEGAPSDGVFARAQRVYYIPKTVYASLPSIGDLITSAATGIDPTSATYTVLGVNDAGALGAWELNCVSLQLQSDLRSTLSFLRPNDAVDSAYRLTPTYTTFASGVAARLQPEGGDGREVFDRVTLPSKYTAFLGQTLALRAKDRAYDGTSYYTVTGFEMPERLDELQRVDLGESCNGRRCHCEADQ